MKMVEDLLEELEVKARAASDLGERIEMDPDDLLSLIKAARAKKECLDLIKTGDLKPGYYEFNHTLYMVDHDYRFKGPFQSVEEAKETLGISQVEIDQAFFRSRGREPELFCGDLDNHTNAVVEQDPAEQAPSIEVRESVDLLQTQDELEAETPTDIESRAELSDLPEHIR